MSKKKVTKIKKKKIDINNIDAMFEDMKNLAIEMPKEECEIVSEKIEETDASIPKEDVTEIVLPEPDGKLVYSDLCLDNVEAVDIYNTEEDVCVVSEEPIEEENKIEEETTEDLPFENEVKEEIIDKEVKKEEKPKSKKKTYQEMFGGTWMGYGYDHF